MADNPKFQVGDKVALFGVLAPHLFYWFDEVAKISPTGLIRLVRASGAPYRADGSLKSSKSWEGAYIRHATPELLQELQDKKDLADLKGFVRQYPFHKLELLHLRQLKDLLDKFAGEKEDGS